MADTLDTTKAKQQARAGHNRPGEWVKLLLNLIDRTISEVDAFSIPLTAFTKKAAIKDILADTPGTNSLGLGDAAGSAITGTTTNSGGTGSANETAITHFALPARYVAGQPVTVRIRSKVSVARGASQTVDCIVKKVGDAALGSDICATAAQTLTTSYADYDFTITPDSLNPGDVIYIEVALATDDTGGGNDGAPTIAAVSVRPTCACSTSS